MKSTPARLLIVTVLGLASLALMGLCALAMPRVRNLIHPAVTELPASAEFGLPARLVPEKPDTLRLTPDAASKLKVQTTLVQSAPPPESLKLVGTLLIEPNSLARVRARFAGEVAQLGTSAGAGQGPSPSTGSHRPIRLGDKVTKDQVLAVVWSKDLGEKKSELVDALSRLRLDEETLQRLQDTRGRDAVPERTVREAERNVAADRIAVDRARRTLRAWRLSEDELRAVESEARLINPRGSPRQGAEPELEQNWARVEVRAPFDGIILEVNASPGNLVDSSLDLFKIADLSKLRVSAYAYEEDIAVLQRLRGDQRVWHVYPHPDADAARLKGSFDQIGVVIDPNQHTAVVMGSVDNPVQPNGERMLRVGQLVRAEIPLPPPRDEVVVLKTALVPQASASAVFVQPDASVPEYVCRKVPVIRRVRELAYLRATPTPEEEANGLAAVKPGERVVSLGAVELAGLLEALSREK